MENEGETELVLEDLKRETQEVMHELAGMEDVLIQMKEDIEAEKFDKDELLAQIKVLRKKIGLLEHLDTQEFEEEKAVSNLMKKLKGMIDQCI